MYLILRQNESYNFRWINASNKGSANGQRDGVESVKANGKIAVESLKPQIQIGSRCPFSTSLHDGVGRSGLVWSKRRVLSHAHLRLGWNNDFY